MTLLFNAVNEVVINYIWRSNRCSNYMVKCTFLYDRGKLKMQEELENIPIESKILITVDEACQLTSLGRRRMLEFTKLKGFPAIIMPGKILIHRSKLDKWLEKNYGRFNV